VDKIPCEEAELNFLPFREIERTAEKKFRENFFNAQLTHESTETIKSARNTALAVDLDEHILFCSEINLEKARLV
jgi:hypothetical protein